jgi:hypothetical protein
VLHQLAAERVVIDQEYFGWLVCHVSTFGPAKAKAVPARLLFIII